MRRVEAAEIVIRTLHLDQRGPGMSTRGTIRKVDDLLREQGVLVFPDLAAIGDNDVLAAGDNQASLIFAIAAGTRGANVATSILDEPPLVCRCARREV